MEEILIRFFVGGIFVSTFALLGDLFKPKSFAGLFGSAPSVALATLALAVSKEGAQNAAVQTNSMLAGTAALFCYTSLVSWLMMHRNYSARRVAILFLPAWAGVAFGLWFVFIK